MLTIMVKISNDWTNNLILQTFTEPIYMFTDDPTGNNSIMKLRYIPGNRRGSSLVSFYWSLCQSRYHKSPGVHRPGGS